MAWLQDDGEDNKFAQFEEEEDGDGVVEEIEEEVIVTERPGADVTPPRPTSGLRPKSEKKRAKAQPAGRAKAAPKKAAAVKKKKPEAKKKKPAARSAKKSKGRGRR